ncbi:MAG: gliding motility-associated C-terminal domain-containing protein, partial [Prevotellaceae bacterium]|nr:gliding motility-associated C-terminal domain-containing protein [Prevotellaceae bacterium]
GSSITVSVADIYWVVAVEGSCQSGKSDEKEVVKSGQAALPRPTVTSNGITEVCSGGSVALEVTNTDEFDALGGTITYQWFNSQGKIDGATEPTYHAEVEDAGYYVVAMDGACQSLPSDPAIGLTVGSPADLKKPEITSTSGHLICEDGSADLVAQIAQSEGGGLYGNDVTYTWYRSGVNIGTTVNNRITVTEGGLYKVVVRKDDCGSKVSDGYQMDIDHGNSAPSQPVITPNPTTIVAGGTRTLGVTVGGVHPAGMTYDWYMLDSNDEYVHIYGPTPNTYYDATSEGTYAVIAIDGNNGCRSIRSIGAVVVEIVGQALEKPMIKVVNGIEELCVGGTVELRAVKAADESGYAPGTQFIWYFEFPQGSGKTVLSETSMTLQVAQEGYYSVKVADSGFGESEESAQKYISQGANTGIPVAPKIISDGGVVVCAANGTLKLTAVRSDNDAPYPTTDGLMFKWFNDGEEVQYTASPVYHAPGSIASANYTVVVFDGSCASQESAEFTVTGGTGNLAPDAPEIEVMGGSSDICSGGTVTLQVKHPSTNNTTTYHWFGVTQGDLNYEGASIAVGVEDTYYAIARKNGCDSHKSNEEDITVSGSGQAPDKPIVNSTTGEFCENGSYTIEVTNILDYDNMDVEYEWHRKVGGLIVGETGSSLIVTSENTYWVVVVDKITGCKSAASDTVEVTKGNPTSLKQPKIALENGATTGEICTDGGSATIRVTNLNDYNDGIKFQWYNSAGKIEGAIYPSYIATQPDDNYRVVAIDGTCQSVPSNSVKLEWGNNSANMVAPKIVAEPDLDPAEMCANGSVKLTTVPFDGTTYPADYTYKWYVNGIIDAQITGPVYVAEEAGLYEVVVLDGSACQSVPAAKEVMINGGDATDLLPRVEALVTSFCDGGSAKLTAKPVNAASFPATAEFQWYFNNQPIYGAPITQDYFATEQGYYSVVVKDGTCTSQRSENVYITKSSGAALAKPKILPDGNPVTYCLNGSIELEAVPTAGDPYDPSTVEYYWYNTVTGLVKSGPSSVYNASEDGEYYVVVYNGCWSEPSDVKKVVVDPYNQAPYEPEITVEPISQTICDNGSVKLTAKPKQPAGSTTYPPTGIIYKWYKDGVEVATTTVNIYHAPWVIGDATVTYTVTVFDNGGCQSKESEGVDITPSGNSAPHKPKLTPSSNDICINGMVVITLTESAGDTYEWYRDGVMVDVNHVPEYHALVDGDYYAVVLDGDCRSVPSDVITINQSGTTAPNKPVIVPDGIVYMCEGGSVELKSSDAGSGVEYWWFKDGVHVATTLSRYYLATAPGLYKVAVKDGNNSCMSQESAGIADVRLSGNTITDVPYITAPSQDLCAGLSLILTANVDNPTGTITGYRWYEETKGFLNETGQTIAVSEAGKYRVVVEIDGLCQSALSAEFEVTESTDPNCFASNIILSVDDDEVLEGNSTYIRVKLANGYAATTNMKIDLSYDGTAHQGPCTQYDPYGDYQIISGTPNEIIIPQGLSTAFVELRTCHDYVYEGDETVVIKATHNGSPLYDSPQTVTIKDYDADGEGKMRIKWELLPTGHPAGNNRVSKGQTALYKLTAYHPTLDEPIVVQHAEIVGLQYLAGTTADPVTQYVQVASGTIPAGDSTTVVMIETKEDGIIERNELVVISEIEPFHERVHAVSPKLFIRSNGLNQFGGFDFNITLEPLNTADTEAEVVEGDSFKLTIALTDQTMVVGEDVKFTLSQVITGLPNMAVAGIDFEAFNSEVTILEGTSKVEVYIKTIGNDVYEGSRQLDLDVVPVHPDDRIVNRTPDPLVGIIVDDDKLCITITSSEEGIDDLIIEATIAVEVHNLSPNANPVVIQLENKNILATHYVVPNEFTPTGFITFTNAAPTPYTKHEFKIRTTLVPPLDPANFDITTYTTVFEELLIDINYSLSNIEQENIDCFEPLTLVNSDDFDQDGLPNWIEREDPNCPGSGDSNNNGIPNEWDPYDPNADDDGDGIPNWMEDTNRDGNPYNDFAGSSCLPNFANPDSDGDGVPDAVENWTNRPYDDNQGEIRIHPALSLNDDGIGNDRLYIENINKYPENKVTIFDRQGFVVYEESGYNNKDVSFAGISKKTKKKVPMGTYFVIVEYKKADGAKKYYDKAVEVRY